MDLAPAEIAETEDVVVIVGTEDVVVIVGPETVVTESSSSGTQLVNSISNRLITSTTFE